MECRSCLDDFSGLISERVIITASMKDCKMQNIIPSHKKYCRNSYASSQVQQCLSHVILGCIKDTRAFTTFRL